LANDKVVRSVIKDLDIYKGLPYSLHIQDERKVRLQSYDTSDIFIAGFEVDTNHKDGLEAHIIDSKGYIHIFNIGRKVLITILSGRQPQIHSYFDDLGIRIPPEVNRAVKISNARNMQKGYNKL
jgi:hypothetical protein